MKKVLKVVSILLMMLGGYYLLVGSTAMMSSGDIGQAATSYDATIDASMAAQAAVGLGIIMLITGLVEGVTGLFGFLGAKDRKGLLIAGIVLSAATLLWSLFGIANSAFELSYLIDLALPVLYLIPAIAVLSSMGKNVHKL